MTTLIERADALNDELHTLLTLKRKGDQNDEEIKKIQIALDTTFDEIRETERWADRTIYSS